MSPRLRYQITAEDKVFITFGPGLFARVPVAEASAFALALLHDLGHERGRKPACPSEAAVRHTAILRRLAAGPCGAHELCEASGEIPGYIARTMGDLVKRGLVVTDGKGRGHKATYSITTAGRSRLQEAA